MDELRCHLISLKSVYELSYRLALTIRESGYKPDLIVAIARGGFAPARFLCDFLRISDMTSIKVQHYAPGAVKGEKAYVKFPISTSLSSREVLVVDDVNDTGDSLRVGLQHLKEFNPATLKTAVLHQKETTDYGADFHAVYVRSWKWIVYPWAVVEDVGSFLAKMNPRPSSVEEAAQRLKEQYSIRIRVQMLERIMKLNSK